MTLQIGLIQPFNWLISRFFDLKITNKVDVVVVRYVDYWDEQVQFTQHFPRFFLYERAKLYWLLTMLTRIETEYGVLSHRWQPTPKVKACLARLYASKFEALHWWTIVHSWYHTDQDTISCTRDCRTNKATSPTKNSLAPSGRRPSSPDSSPLPPPSLLPPGEAQVFPPAGPPFSPSHEDHNDNSGKQPHYLEKKAVWHGPEGSHR
jgi:hypothetical protein